MFLCYLLKDTSAPLGFNLHTQLCIYKLWPLSSPSHSAIYDVVEEKVDSEPDFQYIPEKSPQDPAQLDQHALRDSMVTLKEGLSSGAILAQFDVRRKTHTWTETVCIYFCSFWLIDGFYFVEHLSHISFLLHIPITSCPLSWSLNSFLFKLCVVHLVKLNSKCKHTHKDTNTKCTQSHCIIVLMHTKMLVFEYFSYNWTHRSLCILI